MKDLVKSLIRRAGYELKKYSPASSEHALMKKILFSKNIDLIIDIGANTGQYGNSLRKLGYKGNIISFEPMKKAYAKLEHLSEKDGKWNCFNYAIGNENGEIEINVANNSYSSSILGIHQNHLSAAPDSKYIDKEKIKIKTLAEVVSSQTITSFHSILLKIDVQGYEMEVIKGAEPILPYMNVIQMELSLVPLYEHGPLFKDMLLKMESLEFSLFNFTPEFFNADDGRMLQVNGFFVNNN